MKPTVSKDGKHRATIRINFRVDLDFVRAVIGKEILCFGDIDDATLAENIQRSFSSRRAIEERVRRELSNFGNDYAEEHNEALSELGYENYGEDDGFPETRKVIDDIIRKHYPDFYA